VHFVDPYVDHGQGTRIEDWKLVREHDSEEPLLYRNQHPEQEGGELLVYYPHKRDELDRRLHEHLVRLETAGLKVTKKVWDTELHGEKLPDDIEEDL